MSVQKLCSFATVACRILIAHKRRGGQAVKTKTASFICAWTSEKSLQNDCERSVFSIFFCFIFCYLTNIYFFTLKYYFCGYLLTYFIFILIFYVYTLINLRYFKYKIYIFVLNQTNIYLIILWIYFNKTWAISYLIINS